MTTTYNNVDYTTADELRHAINSELATLAYPYTVNHRIYGEGQLTEVSVPSIGNSLFATIDFAAGTKKFALDTVLTGNLLTMPEILTDILVEAQTIFKADFIERETEKRTIERKAREEAEAAKKKTEADKKVEAQFQKAKLTAITEFDELINQVRPISDSDCFYYSLGWLAAHTGTIQAAIPDYLLANYEKHFGTDTKPYIYDSTKRTSGGHRFQWSLGITARLRKKGLTEAPAPINEHVRETTQGTWFVVNTSFLWDLIDNYGFKLGKTQDLEKIKQTIPVQFIEIFEEGLQA